MTAGRTASDARAHDSLRELAAVTGSAWLVGGALRDLLLGRETTDFDVAVAEDPARLARAFARRAGAHAFLLSEAFGAWRVVSAHGRWQVDVLPVAGGTIEADLSQRDLSVNALALPLGVLGGAIERLESVEGDLQPIETLPGLIDPYDGLADLRARRLRMVSAEAFAQDPLRVLRLARLRCELDFAVEETTRRAAADDASEVGRVAAERIFAELKRIVCCERAVAGLEEMEALGATAVVLPELLALRGVEQSQYHHLDVYEHTLAVLAETIALERDLGAVFAEHSAGIAEVLNRPLADELSRGEALRFGALFHDMAKPLTRSLSAEGRVTFIGHDQTGAELAVEVLGGLRASLALRQYVAGLTRYHLLLGFLIHRAPLDRKAIYSYLRTTDPVQIDVTVLSVADRRATRGRNAERAITPHLALARELAGEGLAWMARPPRAPVRGDEIGRRLGIKPGPELGLILERLREASFSGEAQTREEALALADALHRSEAQ